MLSIEAERFRSRLHHEYMPESVALSELGPVLQSIRDRIASFEVQPGKTQTDRKRHILDAVFRKNEFVKDIFAELERDLERLLGRTVQEYRDFLDRELAVAEDELETESASGDGEGAMLGSSSGATASGGGAGPMWSGEEIMFGGGTVWTAGECTIVRM